MKMSEGVEWGSALHAAVGRGAARVSYPRRVLAEHYGASGGLPRQTPQGVVTGRAAYATPGPSGGFRIARAAGEITVLDVVNAIEGPSSPFACREIRQQGTGAAGPEEWARQCAIASVMAPAHQAWRESLCAVTLGRLVKRVPPELRKRNVAKFGNQVPN